MPSNYETEYTNTDDCNRDVQSKLGLDNRHYMTGPILPGQIREYLPESQITSGLYRRHAFDFDLIDFNFAGKPRLKNIIILIANIVHDEPQGGCENQDLVKSREYMILFKYNTMQITVFLTLGMNI